MVAAISASLGSNFPSRDPAVADADPALMHWDAHWHRAHSVLLERDGFELSLKIQPKENYGFLGLAISAIVPQAGAK